METTSFFPEFQERAAGLYALSTNITLAILTIGLIIKIYQGSMGDMTQMWRAVVATVTIGVLITVVPEWINSLQTAMHRLVLKMGADPSDSSAEFAGLVTNSVDKEAGDIGFMDILSASDGGLGKAFAFGLVFVASKAALAFQYLVFVVQQVLIVFGVALLPIFLGFFQISSMQGVAVRYIQGIISVALWPFGLAVATILTKALLLRASGNGIYRAVSGLSSEYGEQTFFFVIVLTLWILVSSFAAPFAVTVAFLKGTNPGATFLTRLGSSASQSVSFSAGAAATSALSGGGVIRSAVAAVAGGAAGAATGAGGGGGVVIPGAIGLAASLGSGGKAGRKKHSERVSKAAQNLRP